MQVFTSIKSLQEALKMLATNHSIGFVPTMGALHKGHISLLQTAKEMTDLVVVSIFVNPTQFDKKEDLTNYPSTLQNDSKQLESEACDFLFIPSVKEMYAENIKAQSFDFDGLDLVMEGAHRLGHFNGVATVVKKLFDIVKPDYAFFGEKDFQQLQIIKKMIEKKKLAIQIIGVPIYRELDGLAMSSRNARLTESYRKEVPFIYKILLEAKEFFGTNNTLDTIKWVEMNFRKHSTLKLEYFNIADETNLITIQKENPTAVVSKHTHKKYRAFIAVFAGNIRLIDNIALY